MPEIPEKAQNLFEIKGVLTKFMRMLFPLEFRIDSIANSAPMLPFHYPLMPGEMIYLPEKLEPFGTRGDAYIYYFVTTAHLAARHDFGTFKLKLADIAGFEERGETGVEAIDSFVASFDDPGLAGALMRLAESARIDAELARRYRGLAPRIATLNRSLLDQAPSRVAQHDARARGARSRREWRGARISVRTDGGAITSRPCALSAPTS